MRNRYRWRGLAKSGPGRVRVRLAKLLAGRGVTVDPQDLWCQEGGYRRHTWDLACWGSNHAEYQGRKVHLCSWCTMSACVKYGISEPDNFDFMTLEFSSMRTYERHT